MFSPTLSFILFSNFPILIAFFFISFIHLPFFFILPSAFPFLLFFFFISIYFSFFLFPLPFFFFFPFSSKFYSGHFTFTTFQLLTLPLHNLLIFSLKFSLSISFYLFFNFILIPLSFTFLTLSSLHAPTTCLITYILSISNSMPIVCYCFFLVTVDAPLVMGAFRWYKTSCRVHTASLPPAPGMVPLFCKMMEIRDLHR